MNPNFCKMSGYCQYLKDQKQFSPFLLELFLEKVNDKIKIIICQNKFMIIILFYVKIK